MFRRGDSGIEVFLVHPGGPFWAKKDAGAWSIPKGEYVDTEDPLAAARREFQEETSFPANGQAIDLGEITQAGGKVVAAWAIEGDCDPAQLRSNTFRMGKIEVPEVDRGCWYSLEDAKTKLLSGQVAFIDRLASRLA